MPLLRMEWVIFATEKNSMEYFELFEIPVQLEVDKKTLRAKYLELSRKYHPDYFANASAPEQQEALDATAGLNKAFKTLGNREDTIRYVLQQKGLLVDDEKYALSPDFLMEMLEINEAIAEAGMDADGAGKAAVAQQLKNWEHEIYEPVAQIVASYHDGVTTEKELLQVKEYFYRKKYLERLKHQLDGIS
ncbi:Fe-S protein assembly co-chaperone HscB [Paracnuella aquatica]|nr:Fe-S protein assembly co-chaperone HscB [Paracnuella aquatica]